MVGIVEKCTKKELVAKEATKRAKIYRKLFSTLFEAVCPYGGLLSDPAPSLRRRLWSLFLFLYWVLYSLFYLPCSFARSAWISVRCR